jgi:hydrogenase 3 maturation protease
MQLQDQLVNRIQGRVAIVGVGNPCRGDDAAGSLAVRQISPGPGVCVIDAQDVPEHYLGQVTAHRPDTIVLIDAVDLGSPPGSVALLEKDQVTLYQPSTHHMPLSLTMSYLEQESHAGVFLIAIQPHQTVFMQPVSEEVAAAAADIAGMLNHILALPRMAAQAMSPGHFNGKKPA